MDIPETFSQRTVGSGSLILLGELLKIFVICVLFALTAKFFTDLNWPAMLAGIIAGVFGQMISIFIKH